MGVERAGRETVNRGTDRRTYGAPIGMHRPWRDFCVYRRTFTPSAAERAYSRASVPRNATPSSLALCLPFRSRPFTLLLPTTSVAGPFFFLHTVLVPGLLERLKLAGNRPPHPWTPSPGDAPGAEFFQWRIRQDTPSRQWPRRIYNLSKGSRGYHRELFFSFLLFRGLISGRTFDNSVVQFEEISHGCRACSGLLEQRLLAERSSLRCRVRVYFLNARCIN